MKNHASWPPYSHRLLIGIIGAIVLAVGVNGAPLRARQASAKSWSRHFTIMPVATDALRPAEQGFLEGAGDRSRRELRLAELALSQASNSDVRSFAQQLTGDYRQLTDSIEALLRKKGASMPAPLEPTGADPYQRLVEMAGAEFDREFVLLMSKLHEELVTLFEQATADAKDMEVRDFAGSRLPLLREHRNKLTELKKALE